MAKQSPFPGMDPYLESHWRDVHADLIALSRTALNLTLPGDLVARMEERVVIDRVDYASPPSTATQSVSDAGKSAIAEPIVLEFDTEEHTETFVTILDADGGELVTVIEFLSPTNKRQGEGRDEFRRKRNELIESKVNFVEVDLVREGSWRELLRPVVAPARVQTAYRATIRRFHPVRRVELYPISICHPLPTIPIPLRDNDADVPLGLQELVDQAYRNGRYDHTDYTTSCEPPLDEEDAAWADELLRNAGLRPAKK